MAEIDDSGRRKKLIQRFREEGADGFDNKELVELLLTYSIRQKNTDGITDALFKYFGSMSEIMEADSNAVMYTDGITKNSAVLLTLIPQLTRRVLVDSEIRNKLRGIEDIRRFIPKCFIGRTVEYFLLVCLDQKKRMIRYDFVSRGTVNSSTVDLRRIVHLLLVCNASYAVVAHNHPRGVAAPSNDDLVTTSIIVNAMKTLGVELLDHIIVNPKDSYSFAEGPAAVRRSLNGEMPGGFRR